jgi:hypothetical protein
MDSLKLVTLLLLGFCILNTINIALTDEGMNDNSMKGAFPLRRLLSACGGGNNSKSFFNKSV